MPLLVGLEGPENFSSRQIALQQPKWMLYLGRKAFLLRSRGFS